MTAHMFPTHSAGADPFGYPTLYRPWDDGSDSMENAKRRLRAAFEFFVKLGVRKNMFAGSDKCSRCLWSVGRLYESPGHA